MANLPVGLHRLEELVKFCLETAQKMLETNGAFFPFGAVIDVSGNRLPVTGDAKKPDEKTWEVYNVIVSGMRDQFFRGEIVAGAIAAEVTIPPEFKPTYPSGVRVAVESNTVSRIVFLPYQLPPSQASKSDEIPAKPLYGELLGLDVRPSIFTPPPPPAA